MAIDALLVEDHLVRQSIRASLVLERGDEFNVIGEVDNGTEAIQFCRKTPPALVLMDVSMPGLNWIEATGRDRPVPVQLEMEKAFSQ